MTGCQSRAVGARRPLLTLDVDVGADAGERGAMRVAGRRIGPIGTGSRLLVAAGSLYLGATDNPGEDRRLQPLA
jgi:hypothetical protein